MYNFKKLSNVTNSTVLSDDTFSLPASALLKSAHISTVGDLISLTESEFRSIERCREKTAREILAWMDTQGLAFSASSNGGLERLSAQASAAAGASEEASPSPARVGDDDDNMFLDDYDTEIVERIRAAGIRCLGDMVFLTEDEVRTAEGLIPEDVAAILDYVRFSHRSFAAQSNGGFEALCSRNAVSES